MSDYGSTYEEIVRKITSIDSLKKVTRVPGVGAFDKNRPFPEEPKQTEIEQGTESADALQTKLATFVSPTTAKFENTNLRTNVTTFTEGSDVNLFINGISVGKDKYSLNFESPDLIITFNTQLLGFIIDNNDEISLTGVFTN